MTDPMATQGDDEAPGRPGATASPARRRGRDARLVVTGVTAVLLVWFAVVNLQAVRIHFWVTSQSAPLIVVIAIAGVLGAAVSGLASRSARRRRRSHGDA